MSDSSSKPSADAASVGDDWRSRWMLPICGLFLGVVFIPVSLAHGHVNLPILALAVVAVLLSGIGLVDRAAAFMVKDETVRARLRRHASMANTGFLLLMVTTGAIYEASDALRHLQPPVVRDGVITRVETTSGSRGTHYVYLGMDAVEGSFKWSCKWDCSALDSMRGLGQRRARLTTLDREILGVQVGGQTVIDTDASRNGDLTLDALVGVFAAAAGLVIGWQMYCAATRPPAVAATGTVS